MKLPSSKRLALFCRECAEDKKATDIVILDMRRVSSLASYFILCSAQSEPQLKAIAQEIAERTKEQWGLRPIGVEGIPASNWIVVDFGDVVVHIFHEKIRNYYQLEQLWGDAAKI